ncbi:MAG: TIGR02186 family protein [Rhizobiaceae bacterium]
MRVVAAVVLTLLLAASAEAQDAPAQPAPEPVQGPLPAEDIQIGLSTNRVAITTDFQGADLTIFGSVDNIDPQVVRQGRYDVIVVLEGPARPVVVRRKDRVLGVWVNMASQTFFNVPATYALATTRPMQDITNPEGYRQLSLGISNLHIQAADQRADPATIDEFSAALRERKIASGLFSLRVGGVEFLSRSLFRATLALAPDITVGTHRARAFLFRNGAFVSESSAQLAIVKSGFEQRIARTAADHGFVYGIGAVLLALLTGWLGRVFFRRD